MTDHLQAVFTMLGPAENRYNDPVAWLHLEQELGRRLPADYKAIVDAYAPVQLNGNLYLSSHPACAWRNLGQEIRSEAESRSEWRSWESDDLGPDADPRVICNRPQITFGSSDGLIPLASTDQGAAVFLAPEVHGYSDGIVVQGSEGDWAGHAMDFAEWLYRYLAGEEMAGWASAALHPGPVLLEYLPTGPDERTREAHGPDQDM
ncbi:SMI1/KNR4 family protein [Streptomyces sp. ZAF1911]|uniref:SMI1/KNR4 family protein n=1 Tax=Streptomyces sp. ZAF1911 TaxID=2944129 RepID=UPI00237BA86C|nr:SMI1/KNR4 family protein [Streptomyces sp. ZAF1911]MDD9380856.1 SMI1/KNR4 family protein [Streptomyces sp. ZAF1911]